MYSFLLLLWMASGFMLTYFDFKRIGEEKKAGIKNSYLTIPVIAFWPITLPFIIVVHHLLTKFLKAKKHG